MKLIKVKKKDDEKDILVEKLSKSWGNIKDCQTRFKISKNEEYHKYSETCKRICDDINKILNEINK